MIKLLTLFLSVLLVASCATSRNPNPRPHIDSWMEVDNITNQNCEGFTLDSTYVTRFVSRAGLKLTSKFWQRFDNGTTARCSETIKVYGVGDIRGVGYCEVNYPLKESCRIHYTKKYRRLDDIPDR